MSEQNERVIKIDTVSPEEILAELQNKDADSEPEKADVKEEQSVCKKQEDDKASTGGNKSIYELLEEDIMASDIPDAEKTKRLSRLIKISQRKQMKFNMLLIFASERQRFL